jgi:hypothetical protein
MSGKPNTRRYGRQRHNILVSTQDLPSISGGNVNDPSIDSVPLIGHDVAGIPNTGVIVTKIQLAKAQLRRLASCYTSLRTEASPAGNSAYLAEAAPQAFDTCDAAVNSLTILLDDILRLCDGTITANRHGEKR